MCRNKTTITIRDYIKNYAKSGCVVFPFEATRIKTENIGKTSKNQW